MIINLRRIEGVLRLGPGGLAQDDRWVLRLGPGGLAQDDSEEVAASLRMTAEMGSLAADDITSRPPGTRDACPTKETSAAKGGLWGSRLGCRVGGRHTAH